MAHAVSASSSRSDRMSPSALALAVLLHVLVAAALWWLSLDRSVVPPAEVPIDITFEQPKPPEPPPPPPAEKAPEPPPPPPIPQGLSPPAPITADKPTQVPPAEAPSKQPPAPQPPPQREAAPRPQPQPPPARDQALAVPAPTRPPPPAPRPELQPSPLTPAPRQRPPAAAAEPPTRHPFVNPADTYNRARVADNYLWQVVRKLEGYRYEANVSARQGLTVVRVVIARDGRLLDVDIARSSGVPEFDRGVIAGVRAGSPYAPLPPEIKGDRATFNLPLMSTRRR